MATKRSSTTKARSKAPENPRKRTARVAEDLEQRIVVGFGASAGGLEAFTEVLAHLPADTGMAFVLVQHLDPHHASALAQLLSRSSPMPVLEIRDGMQAEPNRVYVIPPNANLALTNGALKLLPRTGAGAPMSIDFFFKSLAEQEGSRAIGVVLSGSATDGTLGLKAIKAEGGISLCQDEQSAKYDGMPRSAIAAGCVDFVLPPKEIAGELVRISRHSYIRPAAPGPGTGPAIALSEEPDSGEILALLRSATGVDFTLYKPATIQRRIHRRMLLNHIVEPRDYVAFMRQNRAESLALFQDLLIHVTSFFRESGMFDFLKRRILPSLLRDRAPGEPLRIWVPGCSTGEEAYSVAIALLEYLHDNRVAGAIQIFGTDLSEGAIEKARAGIFSASIANDVSPERLRQFFVKADGHYQIVREVRDLCIFARQNLASDPPFSKLDLVTCRNVLIYLGPVLQRKLMRTFYYALKPGGFLVLGASENVGTATDLFQSADLKQKIYTRRNLPLGKSWEPDAYQERDKGLFERTPTPQRERSPEAEIRLKTDNLLLSQYCPSAVVVDGDLKILQFRGRTAAFLEHNAGEASLSLLKMSHGVLALEMRSLVHRAKQKNAIVRSQILQVRHGAALTQVRVSVLPVKAAGLNESRFLVVFEEVPANPSGAKGADKLPAKGSTSASRRLKVLEQELGAAKLYLQSVIEEQEAITEELKSANEEILSSNEELQSTNEELLTAKEELQSANEELTTVNEEMQARNVELSQINDDISNLLTSVNIPIVMLGNDLRIRRFTPQAEKVLSLRPGDIGRPIVDFRPKINVPELELLFLDAIDNLTIKESEVQDKTGRTYSMTIRPYRTMDNKIDGAVMSLYDITDRKASTDSRYRRLFEMARDAVVIADAGTGEVMDLNPLVTTLTGYSRMELMGRHLRDTGIFESADLQGMASGLADHETWKRRLSVTNRKGDVQAVDAVASVYQEEERRVFHISLRV
jgi:two-component system CheB/CheR fusion protein